jgi:hypothetical protein
MNAIRLPLDVATWQREGQPYLDRAAKAVGAANAEGLIAVLAAVADEPTGLPGPTTLAFWQAAARAFRNTPEASSRCITSLSARAADYKTWHDAMQPVVAAIRAAGAQQLVAATLLPGRARLSGPHRRQLPARRRT